MNGFQFREFQQGDIEQLLEIEVACFSIPWVKIHFENLLKQDYCIYMVCISEEGQVVGMAGMTYFQEEADIDKVMIHPAYQGRGLGEQLLVTLIEEGRKKGIEAFTLEVRISNKRAISLYEKLGFQSVGIRPRFYEKPVEDANIMWKR